MKTLYLFRHAKSSWDDPSQDDFDRPLNKRGQREAAEMAEVMAREGYRPARIVCSTAQRTRETLAVLLPVLASDAEIVLEGRVYGAAAAQLLDRVRETAGDVPSLLLLGHNPGLEDLADLLVGGGDGQAQSRLRTKFPPAGLAVIEFDTEDWAGIAAGGGRLSAFRTPGE